MFTNILANIGRCFEWGQGYLGRGTGYFGMHRYYGGHMIFGAIGIIALVIVLIIVSKKHKKSNKSEAVQMLDMQYVQGELTEEEYQRKLQIIKSNK